MKTTHVLKMDCGVTVTATFDGESHLFDCVWDPSPPYPRRLLKRVLEQYRPWRDQILKEYAQRTGKKITIVEE